MSQANMDLGILQETQLTDGVYTRGSAGYNIIVMDAPSRHHGGVALFLPLHTPLCRGGGGEVWAQRDGFPSGDGGVTVAHRRGIRRPQGRSDNGDGGGGERAEATGRGADGGGGIQRGHHGAGGK